MSANRISVGFLNSFLEEWEGSVYDIKYKGVLGILRDLGSKVRARWEAVVYECGSGIYKIR